MITKKGRPFQKPQNIQVQEFNTVFDYQNIYITNTNTEDSLVSKEFLVNERLVLKHWKLRNRLKRISDTSESLKIEGNHNCRNEIPNQ